MTLMNPKYIEGYHPVNNANAIAKANPQWKQKQSIWLWIACFFGLRVNLTFEVKRDEM